MTATAVQPVATQRRTIKLSVLAEQFVTEIRADIAQDRLIWPSVPAVVIQIREVMQDPDAGVGAIARAISMDPALATRLLRVANSAHYGGIKACRDLQSAVVRLGNNAIEHVVLLLVVGQVFNVGKRRRIQPHLGRLWRHSTLVAALGEQLCDRATNLKPDVAMLAGLIHDIGALPVLVKAEAVPPVLSNARVLDTLVNKLHAEVGQAMLEAWDLPQELIVAAGEHEDLDLAWHQSIDYVDLVVAANLIAHLDTDHPLADTDWSTVPAIRKLALDREDAPEILARARQREASIWS